MAEKPKDDVRRHGEWNEERQRYSDGSERHRCTPKECIKMLEAIYPPYESSELHLEESPNPYFWISSYRDEFWIEMDRVGPYNTMDEAQEAMDRLKGKGS